MPLAHGTTTSLSAGLEQGEGDTSLHSRVAVQFAERAARVVTAQNEAALLGSHSGRRGSMGVSAPNCGESGKLRPCRQVPTYSE